MRKFLTRLTAVLIMFATVATADGFAQDAKKKDAAKKKAADPKPFVVPDGKPAELVKYIQTMQQKGKRVRSLKEFRRHQAAILEAADRLLKAKTDDETEVVAIQTKLTVYGLLARFGDGQAAKDLQAFAKTLITHKNKSIAEMAATQVLMARAQRVGTLNPKERKALVDDLLKFMAGGEIRKRLSVVMRAAQGLEAANSRELAATVYSGAAKVLAKSKDPKMVSYAAKMVGSARRVMLLGNTIDIKGTTVDGKPFNWSDYKGKVVLIDFWATWCGPCIQELPNVKSMYAKYHNKGFEVVGISLDRSKPKLEAFIKDRNIEWTNLYSSNPKATGWDHPMATHYGIMGIPNVILVDQKGNVVSLRARGRELGTQLEKLLGSKKDKTVDGDKKNDKEKKE